MQPDTLKVAKIYTYKPNNVKKSKLLNNDKNSVRKTPITVFLL